MKIDKQSSKLIKPYVPTPQTLCQYKLGLVDEFIFAVNVGVVLFFGGNSNSIAKYVAFLETSLRKILTRFYPLAGRYDEKTNTIDCNDEGANFVNAKVNAKLDDILVYDKNFMFLDQFIPFKVGASHQYHDSLLAAQVTTFECGGVALGVSVTHKLADASTLCTFIHEWAAMNQDENDTKFTRYFFNSSSFLPSRGLTSLPTPTMSDEELSNHTRIKISMSDIVISNMQLKGDTSNHKWSKVQTVSAIIWRALILVDRAIHNSIRESRLIQAVNLRGKTASLIPRNSCGNLMGLCDTKSKTLETFEVLTNCLSDSLKRTVTDFSKAHLDNEEGQRIVLNSLSCMSNIGESSNVITLSSWCKFPFYKADFGFGKPIWVAPGTIPIENEVQLMDDASGNGVEAYVFLEVKDVPYFKEALGHVNAFST